MTRICSECGRVFESAYSKQRCCSATCSAARNRRLTREAYRTDPRTTAINAARRAQYRTERKCSCCGLLPVGRGLHFLCDRCYAADGDDWKGGDGEATDNHAAI